MGLGRAERSVGRAAGARAARCSCCSPSAPARAGPGCPTTSSPTSTASGASSGPATAERRRQRRRRRRDGIARRRSTATARPAGGGRRRRHRRRGTGGSRRRRRHGRRRDRRPARRPCRGGATRHRASPPPRSRSAAIVTASGPLPGATEGSYRGAAAYFAKVNAAGGVCGRKITLLKGDDGLDPQRARGEFLRLEPQVLAFVGSLAVADSGYVDLVESTGVPVRRHDRSTPPAARPTRVPQDARRAWSHTGPFQYYRQSTPTCRTSAFLYADVGGVRANTPTGARGPQEGRLPDRATTPGAQADQPRLHRRRHHHARPRRAGASTCSPSR